MTVSDQIASDQAAPKKVAQARSSPSPLGRWLWRSLGQRAFRLTFHNWYRVRNAMLRAWGANIEPTVRIRPSCSIERPWRLSMGRKSALGDRVEICGDGDVFIGERTVISQFVCLDAYRVDRNQPWTARTTTADITVGDDVWIAADSVVRGGHPIPDGALVGARSVVDTPVEAWTIASGDPAVSRRPRPYAGRADDSVSEVSVTSQGSAA